ncbi:hypothetical protein ACFXPS_45185, partial [Nocardia sp. NPDC059091]|uniref:hypothetical protein n=1 Tax=Nocardia sp. NPDC059091 TaxID=3346724 RepID=UPI0036A0547C
SRTRATVKPINAGKSIAGEIRKVPDLLVDRSKRTILPHTALTEPASAGHRKINWPYRSEAGGTSATAECRMVFR